MTPRPATTKSLSLLRVKPKVSLQIRIAIPSHSKALWSDRRRRQFPELLHRQQSKELRGCKMEFHNLNLHLHGKTLKGDKPIEIIKLHLGNPDQPLRNQPPLGLKLQKLIIRASRLPSATVTRSPWYAFHLLCRYEQNNQVTVG